MKLLLIHLLALSASFAVAQQTLSGDDFTQVVGQLERAQFDVATNYLRSRRQRRTLKGDTHPGKGGIVIHPDPGKGGGGEPKKQSGKGKGGIVYPSPGKGGGEPKKQPGKGKGGIVPNPGKGGQPKTHPGKGQTGKGGGKGGHTLPGKGKGGGGTPKTSPSKGKGGGTPKGKGKGGFPLSPTNNCASPFGYGVSERNRLASCFGPIVVAAYDSDVSFAQHVISLVTLSVKEKEAALVSGFEFYAQSETGRCFGVADTSLCQLIKCNGQHPAAVGSLATELFYNPLKIPTGPLNELCSECTNEYRGNCLSDFSGGSGGGSGFTIYCTNTREQTSTEIFESGGGGGGGAGPGFQAGGGGGGGLQVLVGSNPDLSQCGGGCGAEVNSTETTCPGKRKLRPKGGGAGSGSKGAQGPKSSKSSAGNGLFPGADEGSVDDTCGTPAFAAGIKAAQESMAMCVLDPDSHISVSSGGGSGGGASFYPDTSISVYGFSTGFSFTAGPDVFLTQNQTDAQLIASCSFPYAHSLCDNAGYSDPATNYALCECPVQQLYDPPSYSYDCPTSDAGVTVTEELIEANCEAWCPDPVTTFTTETCPTLLPACSCKAR